MKLLETEESEFQDVEQLGYLGLVLAFGQTMSQRALRARARSCALRKYRTIESWAKRVQPTTVRFEGFDKLQVALDQNRGVVMCTPHVGPSYWIPLALMRRGLPLTLLIDTANFERLQNDYKFWREHYKGDLADPVQMINAEEPTAAWQMMRALREGRVLFVWLDGNTGLEAVEEAQTTVVVNFCGLKIRVRKGPAFLSAYANAPILPAVARYSRSDRHVIRFEPTLLKSTGESIEDYCQRATQHLFAILETYVRRDSACWEEWYHLHRWREMNDSETEALVLKGYDPEVVLQLVLMLDGSKAEVLKLSQGEVLTNLHNGSSLLLTKELIAILRLLNGKRTVEQVINRLAGLHGETPVMSNLLALCQHGFLAPLGQGKELKPLAPGMAVALMTS